MSYSCVYVIRPDGSVDEHGTALNSHGFGMAVWRQLGTRYNMRENIMKLDYPIWDEFARGRLTDDEDITLGATFDNVWVRKDRVDRVAAAFRDFHKRYCEGLVPTLLELATHIDALKSTDISGICFYVTSLSSDPWYVNPFELTPEERVSLGHPAGVSEGAYLEPVRYNFVRDAGKKRLREGRNPWELFAALEANKPSFKIEST